MSKPVNPNAPTIAPSFLMVLAVISLSALLYLSIVQIPNVQSGPNNDTSQSLLSKDSADFKDTNPEPEPEEDRFILPEVEFLKRTFKRGKEGIPILSYFF
jgi:hypothetical protein